jgi:hypothetical protein
MVYGEFVYNQTIVNNVQRMETKCEEYLLEQWMLLTSLLQDPNASMDDLIRVASTAVMASVSVCMRVFCCGNRFDR